MQKRMSVRPELEKKAAATGSVPTGTVTFLFSDIEGSSRRWEAHPDAMKAAVARHDALMRRAIEEHRGHVFKTVGDAFCCGFASPQDALAGALEAQRALAREDFATIDGLRVRMALHSGCTEEREGDYFGPVVNRVARLMSIGSGGQVLLSGVTYELVRTLVGEQVSFTDLGLHRLRDLTQPERVWQAIAPDLPSDFPPLRSVDNLPNNLPVQVTTFYGREKDLEELKTQIEEHRLVTLFGAGGVGKTRLAVQAAAEVLDRYPDGVWIADLAPITDPELVPSVVARAVGMNQSQGQQTAEILPQWLRGKSLLLILDSCEHVLESVATLADAIHHRCPTVRMLATSRQALDLSGEKVSRVSSLGVPRKGGTLSAADAMQFGSVALFVDRATLVNQSFQLTDENAAIVVEICQRLDGIPLAIELAAARVKVLGISNLAQRLNERFKLLTGGSRAALPRQKTLAALIDWSYDLLSPQERALFNRLAIFAGPFSIEAAAAVCSGGQVDESDVLDLVASLADKSLIVVETANGDACYRLLESTRQYALEKINASGEREDLTRRHADYFRNIAKTAAASFGTLSLSQWLERVEPDLENFRAALEWSLGSSSDAALGGAIAAALEMFWWHGGAEAEGRRWIDIALRQVDADEHAEVVNQLRHALALLTSRMLFS